MRGMTGITVPCSGTGKAVLPVTFMAGPGT